MYIYHLFLISDLEYSGAVVTVLKYLHVLQKEEFSRGLFTQSREYTEAAKGKEHEIQRVCGTLFCKYAYM